MLIDTHAHLDFPEFDKDRQEVIQRIKLAEMKVINVGSHRKACQDSVNLAQKYNFIYSAVGIHPHDAEDVKDVNELMDYLRRLAKKPKVIAIGECGLDYHPVDQGTILKPVNQKTKEKQKQVFEAQFKLAQKLNLAVIIHYRDAHKDLLQLIKSSIISHKQSLLLRNKSFPTGVFHCFSGDKKFLDQVLKMGFYIGFCGNLTFRNAKNLQEIAKIVPLERILLETDCPFLSPEPYRGLRNEPKNVKLIAEFLAQLRGVSFEEIAQATTQNAKILFKIR